MLAYMPLKRNFGQKIINILNGDLDFRQFDAENNRSK